MSAGFSGPPVRYCDRCKVAIPFPGDSNYHCLGCHMTVDPGHHGWVAVEVDSTHTKPRRVEPCPTCVARNTMAGRRPA